MSPSISIQEPNLVSGVLEIINSAILLVDSQGRIAFANSKAAKLFRTSREELLGRDLSLLFMPDDREMLLPNILKITTQRGEYEGEVMLQRLDGSNFIAIIATSAWNDQNGQGLVLTIHNVTRLKELERLLRSSERMVFLGRMLDDISHQIRNPVLAIGGFARRMSKMKCPKPEYLHVILEESARLELLLQTLTDFIRLPRPQLMRMPVKEILDYLVPGIEAVAQDRDMKWKTTLSEDLEEKYFLVDPKIFQLALQNVVINAYEAYEDKGGDKIVEIRIDPPADSRWACAITVKDYGLGIRPGILPHIFDPFFTTKTGHVGMGLTFARRIQEEQEGGISVISDLGSGTSVSLLLAKERRRPIRTRKL